MSFLPADELWGWPWVGGRCVCIRYVIRKAIVVAIRCCSMNYDAMSEEVKLLTEEAARLRTEAQQEKAAAAEVQLAFDNLQRVRGTGEAGGMGGGARLQTVCGCPPDFGCQGDESGHTSSFHFLLCNFFYILIGFFFCFVLVFCPRPVCRSTSGCERRTRPRLPSSTKRWRR